MSTEGGMSRRKLLVTGAAALAVPVLAKAASAANPAAPKSRGWESVIPVQHSSHERFDSRLDELFPNLRHDPQFQAIASLACLITNPHDMGIRAFTTQWSIKTDLGKHDSTIYHYSRRRSSRLHVQGLSGEKHTLKAGNTHLITPFFNWTPEYYKAHPMPDWKKILNRNESCRFFAQLSAKTKSVTVRVGGTLSEDEAVIGQHAARLAKRYRVVRNAEHDQAYALLKFLKHHPAKRIPNKLARMINRAPKVTASRSERWYMDARKSHAVRLLKHFKKADSATFIATLHKFANQPKTMVGRGNSLSGKRHS